MSSRRLLAPLVFLLAPATLAAQAPAADSAGFVVLKGADTVAVERFQRSDVSWLGSLVLRRERPVAENWSAVTAPDGTIPLVEVTISEKPDDPRMKARILQRARVIVRGDSVAVDAMTNGGLVTKVYPTTEGAMPYLNLSFGMLELAVRKAVKGGAAGDVPVPLFNLGGMQTATATLRRDGAGHAALVLGDVTFDLALDADGRIREARIATQDLTARRVN